MTVPTLCRRHGRLHSKTVCGIAGYSLSVESRIDRTLAAQILLAAIAERGSDAAGYAYRGPDAPVTVHKQRTGASQLLDLRRDSPSRRLRALPCAGLHKGSPLPRRQQPSGQARRDPRRAQRDHRERRRPLRPARLRARRAGMTVDSEAIFALVEVADDVPRSLEELYGSMATAWLDERAADTVFAARGIGRPLWLGQRTLRGRVRVDRRCARARRALHRRRPGQARGRRGHAGHAQRRRRGRHGLVRARPLVRGGAPPRRSGARRGPLVPRAARRAGSADRLPRR